MNGHVKTLCSLMRQQILNWANYCLKSLAFQYPVYASINQTIRTPEYDPYDLDIKLKEQIE